MQNNAEFSLDIHTQITETGLSDIPIDIHPGDIIFFSGDLGAGKSTLIRMILRKYLTLPDLIVRSPTYTYYQKYSHPSGTPIYHYDLYRLEHPEDIFLIGAVEYLHDPRAISLIEWPDILGDIVQPTKKISISIEPDGTRRIEIATLQGQATE